MGILVVFLGIGFIFGGVWSLFGLGWLSFLGNYFQNQNQVQQSDTSFNQMQTGIPGTKSPAKQLVGIMLVLTGLVTILFGLTIH